MKKITILTLLCSLLLSLCSITGANAEKTQHDIFDYFENIDVPVYYDLNCDGAEDSLVMDCFSNYYACYSMVINDQPFMFDVVRHGQYTHFFVTDIDETDGFMDIALIGQYKGVWMELFRYDGTQLYRLENTLDVTTERNWEIYEPYLEKMQITAGGGVLRIVCGPESFVYNDFSHFVPVDITEQRVREAFNELEGGLYSVSLNGEKLTFDQNPVHKKDRILVPVRAIFEAMGYSVEWDAETRTVHAVQNHNAISIQIGNKTIFYVIDGVSGSYECDVAPQIITGRTLIPLRGVAECAGCHVEWNEDTSTAVIESR